MDWTCEHCKTKNPSYKESCTKCYRDSKETVAKKRRQQEEDDDRRRRESSSSTTDLFSTGLFGGFDAGSSGISCDGGGGGGSSW